MLVFVPPWRVTSEQIGLLAKSLLRAPSFERPSGEKLIGMLHTGEAHMYEFPQGLLILQRLHGADHTDRVSILAFAGRATAWKMRELAQDLKKIAAEWGCDTIETLCYDTRLASAIQRVGGKLESVSLTLAVEG
jgi:hypothetical protein